MSAVDHTLVSDVQSVEVMESNFGIVRECQLFGKQFAVLEMLPDFLVSCGFSPYNVIGCVQQSTIRSIRFVRRDRSSPMKKNAFVRFYHRDAHYYVIISHNTSVPLIAHLELATGTLMSHASWAWLTKISRFLAMKSDFSQMRPSRSGFDCE